MVLHALSRHVIPFAALSRRGLSTPMHLHENRPTKRAGEAGRELRDEVIINYVNLSHSQRPIGVINQNKQETVITCMARLYVEGIK
ncbi:hypothetical protein DND31_22300 [Klebsiella pneumoniae]|nr:hypothetical protein DND31_22300 [Klebsiella pneumoniae]PZE04807.1 hypothetical protein DND32_22735 [Klebsiella pneumoniae]